MPKTNQYSGVNWLAVREALRSERVQRGKSLRKLKSETGIDPSTVHRIENTKKFPRYQPDLETLDVIVRALGLTLSQFFARIEGLRSPGPDDPQLPVSPSGVRDDRALPVPDVVPAAIIAATADRFIVALNAAVDRLLEARQQTPAPRRHKAVPVEHHRKARG